MRRSDAVSAVRPDSRYARLAARNLAKELLWLASCRHRPGPDPNVLLFASRRGGSTFLMELIGAGEGVRTLDQPLELISSSPTTAQAAELPLFRQGQMTSLDDLSEEWLGRLVDRLLAGEVVINAPTRVWRAGAWRTSHRMVLKIIDAKPIIEWFDGRFGCEIVYLTRHPLPQSMSCIRNGWTLTADAHLRDREFLDRYVPAPAEALARDVMASGSTLRQWVVNWLLENVAPLTALPRHPEWVHVRYEDSVRRPDDTIEWLAERLNLRDVDTMRSAVERPSVSSDISTAETRELIISGRLGDRADAWRDEVDPSEQRWCCTALETFGIDPVRVAA